MDHAVKRVTGEQKDRRMAQAGAAGSMEETLQTPWGRAGTAKALCTCCCKACWARSPALTPHLAPGIASPWPQSKPAPLRPHLPSALAPPGEMPSTPPHRLPNEAQPACHGSADTATTS